MNHATATELLRELEQLGQTIDKWGRRSSYSAFRSRSWADGASSTPERAFWTWLTAPTDAVVPELRALSKATIAGGAVLVPSDFAKRIDESRIESGPLGRLAAEFVTEKGSDLPVPLDPTAGTAAWVAESGASTPSDDIFDQVTLKAYRGTASVVVSEELLADARVELDAFLGRRLGRRLATLEESAFTTADGVAKPLGIVHVSSPIPVVTAATGSATAFKRADVLTALEALPPQYHADASWIMSPSALTGLMKIVDSGQPLFGTGPEGLTMLGRRVFVSSAMPASAASAKAAAIGDWNLAYGVRRMAELAFQRLGEIRSGTGQVEFRLIERIDGRPLLADAARLLAHSAT